MHVYVTLTICSFVQHTIAGEHAGLPTKCKFHAWATGLWTDVTVSKAENFILVTCCTVYFPEKREKKTVVSIEALNSLWRPMAEQIISIAIELFSRLFGETQKMSKQEDEESVTEILNSMKKELGEILKSEAGQRLIGDVGKLAKKVCTQTDFLAMIKSFFQLAKDMAEKWLGWIFSPTVMLTIFLLCIAGLIVYIVCVPQSTVAVWVTSLLSRLAEIFVALGQFCAEKIAKFFEKSSLELEDSAED